MFRTNRRRNKSHSNLLRGGEALEHRRLLALVPVGLSPGDNYYLAFVTSGETSANLGGVAGADLFVDGLGDIGTMTGPGNYRAIISDGSAAQNAIQIFQPGVPIYNTNGALVATDVTTLFAGQGTVLSAPISFDEYGGFQSFEVWTGTNNAGILGQDAGGWTNPLGTANLGFSPNTLGLVGSSWVNNGATTATEAALYGISAIRRVPFTTGSIHGKKYEDVNGNGQFDEVAVVITGGGVNDAYSPTNVELTNPRPGLLNEVTGSAPSIANGSFESPILAANSFSYRPAGTGWVFSGNAGMIHPSSGFNAPPAPGGSQIAFLQTHHTNKNQFGAFVRAFSVNTAGTFTLSFQDAGRPFGFALGGDLAYEVLLDGTVVGSFSTTSNQPFMPRGVSFSAGKGIHQLGFRASQAQVLGDNTAFIDDISIVQNAVNRQHYDGTLPDHLFVESLTFTTPALPVHAAFVRIAAKPIGDAADDSIFLFSGTWPQNPGDGHRFGGNPPLVTDLLGQTWNDTNFPAGTTIDIPLSAGTLADVLGNNRLDIFIEDDTVVDFIELHLWTSEPCLANWPIQLTGTDAMGNPVNVSTTTMVDDPNTPEDETGHYWIENLLPGNYTVTEGTRPGWVQSAPATGSHSVNLQSGDRLTGKDFGNYQSASIHGEKWNDLNGDGVRDPNEPPLAGWTIFIDENNDGRWDPTEPSTVTNAHGEYWFMNLAPGTYVIGEAMSSAQRRNGWQQTFPGPGVLYAGEARSTGSPTTSNLNTIDTLTGAGNLVGPMNVNDDLLGMDFHPDGNLYGFGTVLDPLSMQPTVYDVTYTAGQPNRGVATPVTNGPGLAWQEGGFAIDPHTGRQFILSQPHAGGADCDLFQQPFGSCFGLGPFNPATHFDGLAYRGGAAYGLIADGAGPLNDNLVHFNAGLTGFTAVGPLGVDIGNAAPKYGGLAYDPLLDVFYTTGSGNNNLFRVDPISGHADFIGATGISDVSALTFDHRPQMHTVVLKSGSVINGKDFGNHIPDTVSVPWDTGFCRGVTTTRIKATITNNGPTTETYTFTAQEIAPIPGKSNTVWPPGPNFVYTPGSQSIPIAGNSSAMVFIDVTAPTAWNPGDIATFLVTVTDSAGISFSDLASVQNTTHVCVTTPGPSSQTMAVAIATAIPFTFTNTSDEPQDVQYRIDVMGPASSLGIVSINGLPAGASAEGSFALSPNQAEEVPVTVKFVEHDEFNVYDLIVSIRNEEGVFVPATSIVLRSAPARPIAVFELSEGESFIKNALEFVDFQVSPRVTERSLDFTGVEGVMASDRFAASHGVRFENIGAVGGGAEGDPNHVGSLDGYDDTYNFDGGQVYVSHPNHLEPFTILFDDPVATVGSFVATGTEGDINTLTVTAFDVDDKVLVSYQPKLGTFENPDNREGFWSVAFEDDAIAKVTILNDNPEDFGNALKIDNIQWERIEDRKMAFDQSIATFETFFAEHPDPAHTISLDGLPPGPLDPNHFISAADLRLSITVGDRVEPLSIAAEGPDPVGMIDGYDGSFKPDDANVAISGDLSDAEELPAIRLEFITPASAVGSITAKSIDRKGIASGRSAIVITVFDTEENVIGTFEQTSHLYNNFDNGETIWIVKSAEPNIGAVEILIAGDVDDAFSRMLIDNITFTRPTTTVGDFDGDGLLTCGDLRILNDEIVAGNYTPAYDLNEDGLIDFADTQLWISDIYGTIPGDANLDFVVDALDLNSLALNWRSVGSQLSWCDGDFNGDNSVNAIDLNEMGVNWRFSAAANLPARPPRAPLPARVEAPNVIDNPAGRFVDNKLESNNALESSVAQEATYRFFDTESHLSDRAEQTQRNLPSRTVRRVDDYFARRTSWPSPRASHVEYEDLTAHVFAKLATHDIL